MQNDSEVIGFSVYQPSEVTQIEGCFWHTYQACVPATLLLTVGDYSRTAIRHTLTIQPDTNTCAVIDYIRLTGVIMLQVFHCAGLAQLNGGLMASSCGIEGNVFVPPGGAPTPSAQP